MLTGDEFWRGTPVWSPDGTHLVYRRIQPHTRKSHLFIIPIRTGHEKMLTSQTISAGENAGDWSRDGKWVLGTTMRLTPGRSLIWLIPISAAPHAETGARVVTSHPDYNLWQPRFSPDERWVCFNAVPAFGGESSAVYVVAATGGEWVRITDDDQWNDKPRWSKHGKKLYFLSSRGGFFNLWGRRFDPTRGQAVGEPFQVTAFESPDRMISSDMETVNISLVGDRLALPLTEITGNIWMLDNVDR
jgi:Tol biopolymer transport system component